MRASPALATPQPHMPEQEPVKINTKRMIRIVVTALCLVSTGAGATRRHAHFRGPARVAAPVAIGVPDADGRMFGHLPYDEAPPGDLEIVMPGFGLGVPCRMQHDAAADLVHLLNAAKAHARLAGRKTPDLDDVAAMASYVLPHRIIASSADPAQVVAEAVAAARVG